jgi:small subunit ribosomal protein S15
MLRAWAQPSACNVFSFRLGSDRTPALVRATTLASTSRASTSLLHTSAPALAHGKQKKSIAHARTAAHRQERYALARARAAASAHVVLGTRPGEEHKWDASDLARCIVTEAQVRAAAAPVRGYHVAPGSADERLLFASLPTLTAEMSVSEPAEYVDAKGEAEAAAAAEDGLGQAPTHRGNKMDADMAEGLLHAFALEGRKAEMLERLLDLRNANSAGIAYENRRRIVDEFSTADKPGDTGRTEVQGTCRQLFPHRGVSLTRMQPRSSRSPSATCGRTCSRTRRTSRTGSSSVGSSTSARRCSSTSASRAASGTTRFSRALVSSARRSRASL